MERKILENSLNPLEEIALWLKKSSHSSLLKKRNIRIEELKTPPPYIRADYTLPTFSLGGLTKQDPPSLAARIAADCLNHGIPLVKKVYAVGPYVNIEVDKTLFSAKAFYAALHSTAALKLLPRNALEAVYIHYLENGDSANLRTTLVGKAIGNLFTHNDYRVHYHHEELDRTVLERTTQKVIAEALRKKTAQRVADTDVVITAFDQHGPLVLQRQDGSFTKYALWLAYHKKYMAAKRSAVLLYPVTIAQAEVAESFLAAAQQLRYISPRAQVSTVLINTIEGQESFPQADKTFQYALLRVPASEEALISANDLLIHPRLMQLISGQRAELPSKGADDVFGLAKLVAEFPLAVSAAQESFDPSSLCEYLETVAAVYNTLRTKDKTTVKAVSMIVKTGLGLLLP